MRVVIGDDAVHETGDQWLPGQIIAVGLNQRPMMMMMMMMGSRPTDLLPPCPDDHIPLIT
jgi:hypothetical protein